MEAFGRSCLHEREGKEKTMLNGREAEMAQTSEVLHKHNTNTYFLDAFARTQS
jgi:hypothetical protein